MLFMKGNPAMPQCGFSAAVVGMLKEVGVPFESFNILADPELREGLKEYSSWPTFPQLYVDGKLVGGGDIVRDLHARGELQAALARARGLRERARPLISRLRFRSSVNIVFRDCGRRKPSFDAKSAAAKNPRNTRGLIPGG